MGDGFPEGVPALAASKRTPKPIRVLKITSDRAFVGPFIRCRDEPKMHATSMTATAE